MPRGKKIENFEEKFWQRLDEFFAANVEDKPDFALSGGKNLRGFYTVSAIKREEKNNVIVISATPFTGGSLSLSINIPQSEKNKIDNYAALARQYCEKKNLLSSSQSLDADTFTLIASRNIQRLMHDHAQEFQTPNADTLAKEKLPPHGRGLYAVKFSLPTKPEHHHSVILRFQIRPMSDFWKGRDQYTLIPHRFSLATGCHTVEEARKFLDILKPELEKLGLFEYDFRKISSHIGGRGVPLDWIDESDLAIIRPAGENYYYLQLVRARGRKPPIKLGLGTEDEEQSLKVKAAIVEEFLPQFKPGGARQGETFTLADAQAFIYTKFPPAEKPQHPRRSSDIRQIMVGEDCKLQLYTPALYRIKRANKPTHYEYGLHFVPSPGEHVQAASASTLQGNLNTTDKVLAESRLKTLMDLSEVVITEYFKKNPGTKLVLYTKQHKSRPLVAFRVANPGETAPAGEIFFETLADQVIKPALQDFNRYISWKTDITPAKNHDKCNVTFQAVRNTIEEIPAKVSMFSGPFTIEAHNEEIAKKFAQDLSLEIMRKQYLFSREREVEQFGDTSTTLVIRESLRNILQKYQQDIDLLGSNLLGQLTRDKPVPKR